MAIGEYLHTGAYRQKTHVSSGVLGGIRRIPTSGFFWQCILISVITNKQCTFRPFATPLCVYPPPFLAIHHCMSLYLMPGLLGHSAVVFRVLLTVCVVVFYQWHFIDPLSCIASSLFNKLTYLLTGGFTMYRQNVQCPCRTQPPGLSAEQSDMSISKRETEKICIYAKLCYDNAS